MRRAGDPGRGGSRPGQLTRRPPEQLRGLAGLEGLRDNRRLPNKRLKLAAPGLGRIPFVRQHTSCSFVKSGPPAAWGAAA